MKLIKCILIIILTICYSNISAGPGKVVTSYKTPGSCPTGLTFDGKNLWLADRKTDKLYCINPANGEIVKELPSPGFWPAGLAWDGKHLWNIDTKQNKIFEVCPNKGTILGVIDAPGSGAEGLTWDGNTLWVSDPQEDKIMKIDMSDGTAVKSFDAPNRNVQGLTFDGTYFWCSDRIADEIYMIDYNTGEVIIVAKSPAQYPRGMAWDGKYLWNVDYQTDMLYQLAREDEDLYTLENTRHAKVTFTHEVKGIGNGQIKNLDVYIAIPENLPQQVVEKIDFEPADYKTLTDKWNQKYAHFNYKNIDSGTPVRSIMTVETKISDISYYIYPDRCGTLADIPKEVKTVYTANDSKYQIDDKYIQDLSKEIVGDEKNPYWIARKIFDYVRNTLEYKLEGGWNVAPVVLQRGTGSCSEYTFSFVALCRAAGLPARYVGSLVVRGDDASMDEVFHRWPEVYLPNYGWVPIDPQGGDRPLPRDRAMNIGHLSNRFLITTQCGGYSQYMGWYYNSYETYSADPQVQVNIESIGEWEPIID
ncbi:MAG: transglutaminase [Ignavibacteria bacterium RBG_13_36_8]|nr:MAG: transglutaminase [Ignavibacteria bacterium RBG_13_36_8]